MKRFDRKQEHDRQDMTRRHGTKQSDAEQPDIEKPDIEKPDIEQSDDARSGEKTVENFSGNGKKVTPNPIINHSKNRGKGNRGIRCFLGVFFAILVFVLISFAILVYRVYENGYFHGETMAYALENIVNDYTAQQKIDAECETLFDNKCIAITKLIENSAESISKQKDFQDYIQGCVEKGKVYCWLPNETSNLSNVFQQNDVQQLKQQGYLKKAGQLFTYAKTPYFELAIEWEPHEELGKKDLSLYVSGNQALIIQDLNSGKILEKSMKQDIEIVEEVKFDYGFDDLTRLFFKRLNATTSESGFFVDSNQKIYLYVQYTDTDHDLLFTAIVPVSTVISETLHGVLPQLLFMLSVYLLTVWFAIRLFRKRAKYNEQHGQKKILGKLAYDQKFTSHILGFLVFGALITITLTIYIQVLINYSTRNIRADQDLKKASQMVENMTESMEQIENFSNDSYREVLQVIADLAVVDPSICQTEKLETIAEQLGVQDLILYDEKGKAIASTSGQTGYYLTVTELKDKNVVRWIAEGTNGGRVWEDDQSKYIAICGKDNKSIWCLKIDRVLTDELKTQLQLDSVMMGTNFNLADKIFVDLRDLSKVYLIEADKLNCSLKEGPLEEVIMSGNFTGQFHYNNHWYYINELKTDKYLFINASREGKRWRVEAIGALIELFGLMLLMLVLFFTFGLHRYQKHFSEYTANDSKRDNKQDIASMSVFFNKLEDRSFRKMLSRLLTFTVVILLVCVFVEMRYYSNIVGEYLFNGSWEHKFNLFSVTAILLFVIFAKILYSVITKIIILISKNTGPKGLTIGRMLCSLLGFGAMMGCLLFTLTELGVQLKYLMTATGVASVIIGYACQGVINDLLSGLFIVFEGNFHVGDWVTVGDWRGEVKEIGVRTTKIAKGGDVRIFNNSCLNTLTVWSNTMDGALVSVSVDYHTDLDYALNLILENADNYKKACPHIIDGPGVHGVTELGNSGITIRIWASVDDQNFAGAVERSIMKETKRLFDEHGVVISFPQIVVHQENE